MFEHDKRGKKTACRLAGKLHRLHKKRDKFPSVCVFVCVCDLHMYFALSSVSEIPHINRQLSIGHILFLPHLEKYQFHLCCCFPLPSPTSLPFASSFHCRCCLALALLAVGYQRCRCSGSAAATTTTTTTECQELIGVQHLHTLHMCVCV